jgi:ASC-1-like (ASCH) protein
MVYDVLNKIIINEIELTFYLIIPKKRFEMDYQIIKHQLKINNELLNYIKSGEKIYDILCNKPSLSHILSTIKRNDIIEYKSELDIICCKIKEVIRFRTFEDALNIIDFKKISPNQENKDAALLEFNSNYSVALQKSQGGIFVILL